MTTTFNLAKLFPRATRILVAFCVILVTCLAQAPTAILVGRISDSTGGVAPNAAVDMRPGSDGR